MIEAAFSELETTNKPVLLLLDEVQHLATSPDFYDFTAALRSFMTARSDQKVKGIFSGSSQEGLAQLFKRTKAPFFNASSQLEFPELDENKNSVIQNAVNRLKSHAVNAIYSNEHGVWRFTDPSFKRFVQSQDD